jgi:flagellar biosynthetic protein FliR
VSAPAADVVLAVFLIFCRIGGCLMVAPGLSSPRVPNTVRLFLALALSLALTPMLVGSVVPVVAGAAPATILERIAFETLTGVLIGMLGRLFLLALQTFGILIAQSIGFGAMPGVPYEGEDAAPTLASLLTVAATALIFITDLHWELVRGLVDSYEAMPVSQSISMRFALMAYGDQLTSVFITALRISSPFVFYSVMVNLAMGLVNKLTPTFPVYFVMMPVVLVGGIVLLLLTFQEFMTAFVDAFGAWVTSG